MSSLVIAENLKTYFEVRKGLFKRLGYVKAVDGVNLDIKRGETLALVGESGSGKTTLGRTLLKLIEPTEGKIIFDGIDITHLKELKWFRRKTGMIFQDPYSSIDPMHKISFIVEEPLIVNNIGNSEERREKVYEALRDVKLEPPEDFAGKYPHMLSGGQRQRVAIARVLIMKPEFIVADEPVSMLDASVRVEILTLLRELQFKYKISFLYITHDLATAKYFSDRIAVMYAGKIVELGPTKEVIKEPLHPYTKALIDALPDPDPSNRYKEREIVGGEPPNLINPPSGCRFHPRCPYFMKNKCEVKEPDLIEKDRGRWVSCYLYQ